MVVEVVGGEPVVGASGVSEGESVVVVVDVVVGGGLVTGAGGVAGVALLPGPVVAGSVVSGTGKVISTVAQSAGFCARTM